MMKNSLMITIPVAGISILYFYWGIQSLLLLYCIGCLLNTIALFVLDLDYLSYKIMVQNSATGMIRLGWSGFGVLYISKNDTPFVSIY